MRLYLIRHPQPDVAAGLCYGSSDLAANQLQQDHVLAQLVPGLPPHIPIFTSPLRRCAGLAHSLSLTLKSPSVIEDPRLMEMHFGAWEMRPWDTISRSEIDAWAADLIQYCPGGGESVMQMAQRVKSFHDELLQNRQPHAAVVCHAGTIRLLLACQRDMSLAEMAHYAAQQRHTIQYGEMILLDC